MLVPATEMKVPRLELRWEDVPDEPNKRICWYTMVLPLRDIDCRLDYHTGADKENKTLRIPICHTIESIPKHLDPDYIGPVFPNQDGGSILLPFRDKMHAIWDAAELKLPVYVSYKDQAQLISSPGQVIYSREIVLSEHIGYRKNGE